MRAWIRPTALVGRIRSLYSACWKTCVVEKAQAHWVGRWLTVPQEAGRAGPRQAPRLPGSQALPPRPHSRHRRGRGSREKAGRGRFEPLMAPTTVNCTPW